MKKQWEISNRFDDFRKERFNFPKSSGGQDVKNHLGKLDTWNEIPKKNHSGKYIEEKFLTRFKPPTRIEFQRRTYSFETAMKEGMKETHFPEIKSEKKKSFNYSNLPGMNGSSAQCVAQEKEMTKKLREIRKIIEEIQKTSQNIINERQQNGVSLANRNTGNWSPSVPKKLLTDTRKDEKSAAFSSSFSRQPQAQIPHLEPSSYFKRKLVPIRFSSSFTVEVKEGSPEKTFTEEITFQKRLVPAAVTNHL